MISQKMTSTERRAVISLSSIMSLRMIGLFMVLPVFALYAHDLHGATPLLLGIAMGIYGLCQAIFQIPLGSLSDRIGRKPVIMLGLLIFAAGSLIAGFSHSIALMIVGRALQGVGAVGSTILAMMADLTREEQRTKSMAIAGISIGFSFMLAMLIGPILTKWFSVSALFFLAALMGLFTILILFVFVPVPQTSRWHRDTEPEFSSFLKLLVSPELAKLNSGIFILHAIFTATFTIIPISLHREAGFAASHQWHLYTPALLIAFVTSLLCIGYAERKQQIKPYFLAGITAILLAECLFWAGAANTFILITAISFFFCGFSLLEAFLPSLVSRTAPADRKGSAMGLYSCSQFFGIFVGGTAGGWLFGYAGFTGVYLFCIMLALFWFILAFFMQPPRYLITHVLHLNPSQQQEWNSIAAQLNAIPGIKEISLIAEEGTAYLKMERGVATHPDFIYLKEQLGS